MVVSGMPTLPAAVAAPMQKLWVWKFTPLKPVALLYLLDKQSTAEGMAILLDEQSSRSVASVGQAVQQCSHRTQALAGSPQYHLSPPDKAGQSLRP